MIDKEIYPKIFTWLCLGLLITFGSGYFLSINELLAFKILTVGIIPIIIIELVIAILMGFRIKKMHPLTAKIFYLIYCITTGITFSTIFMTYELTSLLSIFLLIAIIFAVMAIYGYFTKRDLSKFETFIFITLIIMIIISLLNVFIFRSSITNTVLSALGVLIFCGYIAYDINKIKYILPTLGVDKTAIYGAFQLYLDFINLFIRLLELFGKKKD